MMKVIGIDLVDQQYHINTLKFQVMYEYPTGVTPICPKESPRAESKPAEIIRRSGANSLMIGKKIVSHAYM
jgi:hypothetical protein